MVEKVQINQWTLVTVIPENPIPILKSCSPLLHTVDYLTELTFQQYAAHFSKSNSHKDKLNLIVSEFFRSHGVDCTLTSDVFGNSRTRIIPARPGYFTYFCYPIPENFELGNTRRTRFPKISSREIPVPARTRLFSYPTHH